jgi:hypothetical protein
LKIVDIPLAPARPLAVYLAVGERCEGPIFLAAAFDSRVSLRDVQETASHTDPPTTMRYDRARVTLDRHATYIVAALVAGVAR